MCGRSRWRSYAFWISLFSLMSSAQGATLFVDPQIDAKSINTYDIAARAAGRGTQRAYRRLADAAESAMPGDAVIIRGGTYGEPLKPKNSGTTERPIVFRGEAREKVIITGAALEPAIDISHRSYITIEGLSVQDVKRWLYAVGSHHNVLRNNRFMRSLDEGHSSKSGIFFQQATYNRILNNTIEDCAEDSLTLVKSDRNVVQGNTFVRAHHALLAVRCGSFNVIRGNFFRNPDQKIMEVYDCERAGFEHDINEQKTTRYNLIEGNTFAGTKYSAKSWYYNAIQYGAQNGIIRGNLFYDNEGGALALQVYPAESLFNLDNHVYHNVFCRNHHGGILIGRGEPNNLVGNIFKNNALVRNQGEKAMPTQIMLNGLALYGYLFENNIVFGRSAADSVVNHMGRFDPLAWWQNGHENVFKKNLSVDPLFVDEARENFHLKQGSPAIDAGAFLTRVRSGQDRRLEVEDAGYFFDGYGIPGEHGDLVQLEGSVKTARVVKIDYMKNAVFLDVALPARANQQISLPYRDLAPDIGAYEFTPAKQ